MEVRQLELPMPEMMEIINESLKGESEEEQRVARALVIEAYELHPYVGPEAQQKASLRFANQKSAECYARFSR